MRGLAIGLCGFLMFGVCGVPLFGQGAARPSNKAATNKAEYWSNTQLQDIWKDLEARDVLNNRVMEGDTYSLNIRLIRETSLPMVHQRSIDLWIIRAGNPTSITGGKLVNEHPNPNARGSNRDDTLGSSIQGGVEQPMKPGDIIFVPTGVPHGFKNTKGFRALLIRWEIKAPGVGAR